MLPRRFRQIHSVGADFPQRHHQTPTSEPRIPKPQTFKPRNPQTPNPKPCNPINPKPCNPVTLNPPSLSDRVIYRKVPSGHSGDSKIVVRQTDPTIMAPLACFVEGGWLRVWGLRLMV